MATLRILRSNRYPLWALLKRLFFGGGDLNLWSFVELLLALIPFRFYISPLLGLLFLAFFVVRCSPNSQYAPFPIAGLDAFVVNGNMQENLIYTYDDTGGFGVDDASRDMGDSRGVALGDLDGNGNLDAFVVNSSQPNRLYVNDGSGNFTASDIPASGTPRDSQGVSLRDLDGDGDLDAFVVNDGQTNRIYTNDGSGNFTASDIPASARDSAGVALGDLDGDGDLDAFVVNDGDLNRLYVNDGSGSAGGFTVSDAPGSARNSAGVALGDLDGDGDLDAFVVNGTPTPTPTMSSPSPQPNRLYVNDGSGGFTVSDAPGSARNSAGVALGDLDGDGDLDAFVVNNGQLNRLYLNNGSGIFTVSDAPGSARNSAGVALGDLDGDGNLDAFVVNDGQTNRIYTNDGTGGFGVSDDLTRGGSSSRGVSVGDLHGR